MSPNEVTSYIRQSRVFSDTWAKFSREEKEEVIRRMETKDPAELEKVLTEVKTGQNRLF